MRIVLSRLTPPAITPTASAIADGARSASTASAAPVRSSGRIDCSNRNHKPGPPGARGAVERRGPLRRCPALLEVVGQLATGAHLRAAILRSGHLPAATPRRGCATNCRPCRQGSCDGAAPAAARARRRVRGPSEARQEKASSPPDSPLTWAWVSWRPARTTSTAGPARAPGGSAGRTARRPRRSSAGLPARSASIARAEPDAAPQRAAGVADLLGDLQRQPRSALEPEEVGECRCRHALSVGLRRGRPRAAGPTLGAAASVRDQRVPGGRDPVEDVMGDPVQDVPDAVADSGRAHRCHRSRQPGR